MLKSRFKLLTIADYIMVFIIMSGAMGSYIYLQRNKSKLSAYIYYHNNLYGVYKLSQEQIIKINDRCSAQIMDHKIRMLEADCLDKRCIKQGWSDYMPIICLPNQIVIEIKAENQKRKIHILR